MARGKARAVPFKRGSAKSKASSNDEEAPIAPPAVPPERRTSPRKAASATVSTTTAVSSPPVADVAVASTSAPETVTTLPEANSAELAPSPSAQKRKGAGRLKKVDPEDSSDDDDRPPPKKMRKVGKPVPKKRGAGFSEAEDWDLLELIHDWLPIGKVGWDRVEELHSKKYPGRVLGTLRKRFKKLHDTKASTGDPFVKPTVLRAKELIRAIVLKSQCSSGEESFEDDDGKDDDINTLDGDEEEDEVEEISGAKGKQKTAMEKVERKLKLSSPLNKLVRSRIQNPKPRSLVSASPASPAPASDMSSIIMMMVSQSQQFQLAQQEHNRRMEEMQLQQAAASRDERNEFRMMMMMMFGGGDNRSKVTHFASVSAAAPPPVPVPASDAHAFGMSTVDDDGHSVIGIDPENSDSSDNSDSSSTEDVADKGEV